MRMVTSFAKTVCKLQAISVEAPRLLDGLSCVLRIDANKSVHAAIKVRCPKAELCLERNVCGDFPILTEFRPLDGNSDKRRGSAMTNNDAAFQEHAEQRDVFVYALCCHR